MSRESAQLSLESSLTYLTSNFASYNYRANKTIVEWLKNRPAELIGKEISSKFTSLKQSLTSIQEQRPNDIQS